MEQTVRDMVKCRLTLAFGEPTARDGTGGLTYRWRLERKTRASVIVTLNSASITDSAHVFVSDPYSEWANPAAEVVIRTDAEVDAFVSRVLGAWRGGAAT